MLRVSVAYSFSLLCRISLYERSKKTHSFVDGHRLFPFFLDFINKAAVNILICGLVDIITHFCWVYTSGGNYWVTEICIFNLITNKHFSRVILTCISLTTIDILFCDILQVFGSFYHWVFVSY